MRISFVSARIVRFAAAAFSISLCALFQSPASAESGSLYHQLASQCDSWIKAGRAAGVTFDNPEDVARRFNYYLDNPDRQKLTGIHSQTIAILQKLSPSSQDYYGLKFQVCVFEARAKQLGFNLGSGTSTPVAPAPQRPQSPAPQVPAGAQTVYGHFPDYPDFPYYPNNKQDMWFTVPTAQGCLAQQHFLPADANNSREQRMAQAMKYKTLDWQGTGCVPGEPINGTGTLTLRYAFQTSSYWASWSGTMVNGAMNGPVRLANSRRPDQYTMTYYGGCAKVAPESGMSACTPLPKQHGSASSSPQTAQNNAVRKDGPKGPVPNVAVNTVMNGPAGLPTCIRIEKVGTNWNSPKAEIDPQVVTTVRMTNACGKNVLILVRYSSDGENNWTDAVWKGGMLFANGALRSWPVGPARPVIPFPSTDRDMVEPFEPGTVVAEIIHGAAKVYGPINFKLAYCPLAVKVDGEWRTNVLFHEVPADGVGRIVCVPLPKGY